MEVAIGAADAREWRVTDALQQRAVHELARRGVAVLDFEAARTALPDVPTDPANAARNAKAAGIRTPVLFGDLRRFTVSGDDGVLVVRLELALVDPESGDLLWTGKADRPVAVKSALTSQEVVLDAGSAIFAQAFGND
jgi:TolB-like protein